MKNKVFSGTLTIIFFISFNTIAIADEPSKSYSEDTARVNKLLSESKALFGDDPGKAILLATKAKDLATKIYFNKGIANSLKQIGIAYYNQSKHIEALDFWTQSLEVYQTIKDEVGVANILSNIGAIYMDEGDDEKALDFFLRSLKVAERTGDKLRMVTAMNNVGAVYYHKKETHDKALHYYLNALKLSEEIGDQYGIGTTAVNIGEIYFEKNQTSEALKYYKKSLDAYEIGSPEDIPYPLNNMGKVYASLNNYSTALNYHQKALSIAKKLNAQQYIAQSHLGIGNTYAKNDDFESALTSYHKAEIVAKETNSLNELLLIYQGLASSYSATSDYKKAFTYQTLFTDVKNDLYNIETNKKLAHIQFDFDLQKKQGQIDLLTKDKSLKESQIKRQHLARNALITGLALVLFIALLIFRNYRIKVKTHKILDKQKAVIESLLLNILPAEVAKELQTTGSSTPRSYDSVSVLFTDFKGFTSIADKMSPEELVDELSSCFVAFDMIIERNNLEKIKTIGDAYMCAGGIPSPDLQHPFSIINAGLEIQQYIDDNNERRIASGLLPWEIRIGIHIGPVVAGVVGKKKYAYDIWGNTVNIASRMESNGSPGKVNISAALYEIVKEKYFCTHRGRIYAKNVGEIDMYFVEGQIEFQKDHTSFEKLKIDPQLNTIKETEIMINKEIEETFI